MLLCVLDSPLQRKSDFLHKQEDLGKQNRATILFAEREFCRRTGQVALTESMSVFQVSAVVRRATIEVNVAV